MEWAEAWRGFRKKAVVDVNEDQVNEERSTLERWYHQLLSTNR